MHTLHLLRPVRVRVEILGVQTTSPRHFFSLEDFPGWLLAAESISGWFARELKCAVGTVLLRSLSQEDSFMDLTVPAHPLSDDTECGHTMQ